MTDLRERNEEAPDVKEVLWDTGGYECDTCGWNPEYGRFYLWPDGECYLDMWIGCYSGGYFEGRDAVLEELKSWRHLEGWESFAKDVRTLLNRV